MKLRSGSSEKPFGRNSVDAAAEDQLGRAVGTHAGDAAAAIGDEHVAARRRHDAFRPRQILAEEGQIGRRDGRAPSAPRP